MKACVECGAEIRDLAAYCDLCGFDQERAAVMGFGQTTLSGQVPRGSYEGTALDLPYDRLSAASKKVLATLWQTQIAKLGPSPRYRVSLFLQREGKPRPMEDDVWSFMNGKGFVAYDPRTFGYYLSDCGMDYCELNAAAIEVTEAAMTREPTE